MSETTCPKCGSQYTRMRKTLDDDWSEKYRCGTALYVDENGNRRWDQSLDCMFREKELQLAALQAELDAVRLERDKLKDFKSFVHKRLDDMGVPENPEPPNHALQGCRIGDRLDWVQERLTATRAER